MYRIQLTFYSKALSYKKHNQKVWIRLKNETIDKESIDLQFIQEEKTAQK